jgi:hypothetical protein
MSQTMIRDATALAEVQKSWGGVESLRQRLQVSALASVAGSIGGIFPFVLSNAAHNLPFIHAFAVFNDVLQILAGEGHFNCKSIFLGALLKASEKALPWRDYALIVAGADLRNAVAHRGQLLDRGECWKYVDAIKSELQGWHIV